MAKNDAPQQPATAGKPEPATPAGLRVRFSPPAYAGKNAERPNVADAVLIGVFGSAPLEFAGFTLAKSGSSINVYMGKCSPITSAPEVIQPARMVVAAADSPWETDSTDGTMPVRGGREAVEALRQSIRDAWTTANAAGKPYGTEYPLNWNIR